jgi:hypothetical protein
MALFCQAFVRAPADYLNVEIIFQALRIESPAMWIEKRIVFSVN